MAALSIVKFLFVFVALSLVLKHFFSGIFGKDERGIIKAIKVLFLTGGIILAFATVEFLIALYT